MKQVALLCAAAWALAVLGGTANAKTAWEQISETAPRMEKPFEDLALSAPRSVFVDIEATAPRAGTFEDLDKMAP